jgi:hypothetical protein
MHFLLKNTSAFHFIFKIKNKFCRTLLLKNILNNKQKLSFIFFNIQNSFHEHKMIINSIILYWIIFHHIFLYFKAC